MSTNLLCLLPELILTITGVIVMLAEPMITPGRSRASPSAGSPSSAPPRLLLPPGISTSSSITRWDVLSPPSTGRSKSTTSPSSSTSSSRPSSSPRSSPRLDYFENGTITHAGEYFALVCFGATGMMFMTSSVELLMVFIGLEISSISTYILAGFRKGRATASESSIKYFLLGSFATGFFLYGIALCFGATGSTSIAAIAAGMAVTQDPAPRLARR